MKMWMIQKQKGKDCEYEYVCVYECVNEYVYEYVNVNDSLSEDVVEIINKKMIINEIEKEETLIKMKKKIKKKMKIKTLLELTMFQMVKEKKLQFNQIIMLANFVSILIMQQMEIINEWEEAMIVIWQQKQKEEENLNIKLI
ncbi:MAG: hypothetical protein EZS28_036018 [Streblomastix strix]|uniref:Uncharacterized protein n=1 Tax=Streblomastix strix TaxID=222440 RepID=A0A5J4UFV9_9EUKA|nr:MAG: hypothetical protein EZS28_036018 [Streblomastix strix]